MLIKSCVPEHRIFFIKTQSKFTKLLKIKKELCIIIIWFFHKKIRRGKNIDKFFKISERGSTVRTEIIAGLTTNILIKKGERYYV